MSPPRTRFASYWLHAGRQLRISYNSRFGDRSAAAFLKIDVLRPYRIARRQPAEHLSIVLKGWEKLQADRDYVGYAQRFLAAGHPVAQRYKPLPISPRQLPLF